MAKEHLSPTDTKNMMLQVADAIIAAEPILTDADRALGDGDHGVGMERGMNAVKEKLEASEYESVGKVFMDFGMAMMSSMGGASGAVFGTLFRTGGKSIKDSKTFGSQELAELITSGTEAVIDRGGAKPGDKTMIDALDPAATAAKAAADQALIDAITATAAAGEAGRDASKAMVATMGRAKTLGERSVGHPDAGAVSVAIILNTMKDFIAS